MEDIKPIIWVIGGTRSCKTAIAENGIAPLGFALISTGDYFRAQYGQPDTFSRQFVFNISAHSAGILALDPDCHLKHLRKIMQNRDVPLVVEGERNPIEFAKLYHPKKDMVVFVNRLDIDPYDTVIERGIRGIEDTVRWCVSTGIAPQSAVMKLTFGLEEIKAEEFGIANAEDVPFLNGRVKKRLEQGTVEERYPWINVLIGCVRERITAYYDLACKTPIIENTVPLSEPTPNP